MTKRLEYMIKPYIWLSAPAPPQAIEPERDPCVPSPCGPNAQCQTNGKSPACSCLPNYIGSPPNCRPECVINPDCSPTQACINSKCTDPCPGSCGLNAQCQVVSHAVSCTCSPGFTGNPFVQCLQQESKYLKNYFNEINISLIWQHFWSKILFYKLLIIFLLGA